MAYTPREGERLAHTETTRTVYVGNDDFMPPPRRRVETQYVPASNSMAGFGLFALALVAVVVIVLALTDSLCFTRACDLRADSRIDANLRLALADAKYRETEAQARLERVKKEASSTDVELERIRGSTEVEKGRSEERVKIAETNAEARKVEAQNRTPVIAAPVFAPQPQVVAAPVINRQVVPAATFAQAPFVNAGSTQRFAGSPQQWGGFRQSVTHHQVNVCRPCGRPGFRQNPSTCQCDPILRQRGRGPTMY